MTRVKPSDVDASVSAFLGSRGIRAVHLAMATSLLLLSVVRAEAAFQLANATLASIL